MKKTDPSFMSQSFHSAVFYVAVFYSAVFYSAVFHSAVFYFAVLYFAVFLLQSFDQNAMLHSFDRMASPGQPRPAEAASRPGFLKDSLRNPCQLASRDIFSPQTPQIRFFQKDAKDGFRLFIPPSFTSPSFPPSFFAVSFLTVFYSAVSFSVVFMFRRLFRRLLFRM